MKDVKLTNKTLYDYIKEAKSDMILYFAILGILIIVQIILYILYGIPVAIIMIAGRINRFRFGLAAYGTHVNDTAVS